MDNIPTSMNPPFPESPGAEASTAHLAQPPLPGQSQATLPFADETEVFSASARAASDAHSRSLSASRGAGSAPGTAGAGAGPAPRAESAKGEAALDVAGDGAAPLEADNGA